MGTSLKTICFPLANLATITEASVTNFAQISVTLPEGSKVFKKVWVEAMAADLITATGGTIGEWRLGLRLGAAGYTTVTNLTDIAHSGEQMCPYVSADFTAHFTTNWAAQQSSEVCTCDLQIYLDQTSGTTLNFINGQALLWITYEYDDTSATQVKTAFIPFDSPLGALGTSKPGSANDTLPAFDTFFPEASVAYKACGLLCEGNEAVAGSTAAAALNVQLDSLSAFASGSMTADLASDRYFRIFADWMSGGSPIFTTSATHGLYVWNTTTGRMNHLVMTAIVTYTYNASGSNNQNVSLLLGMNSRNMVAPGTTSADYCRLSTKVMIEEPATITIQKSAVRLCWDQIDAVASLLCRVGSQSFVTYTDTAAALCGNNALQRTCNDVVTVARGSNEIFVDIYRTDTSDRGWGLSAMLILNYTCGKPSGGYPASNHTVQFPLRLMGDTDATLADYKTGAVAPGIPEANYWLNNLSVWANVINTAVSTEGGSLIYAERLSGEGWIDWELLMSVVRQTDPEVGVRLNVTGADGVFKENPADPTPGRLDIGSARRWWFLEISTSATLPTFGLMFTYHSITRAIAGSITGSAGGTVNVKAYDATTGQLLVTGSRSGNGAYSLTWYDNVSAVCVEAREDATHLGRSDNGNAA